MENVERTYDTPSTLNAKLNTERARGETAEAIGNDPERDEAADEEDEDTVKSNQPRSTSGRSVLEIRIYVHDCESATDILTGPSGNSTACDGTLRFERSSAVKAGGKNLGRTLTQLPMIVATVAS